MSPLDRIRATAEQTEFMGGVDDRVGLLRSDIALLLALADAVSAQRDVTGRTGLSMAVNGAYDALTKDQP